MDDGRLGHVIQAILAETPPELSERLWLFFGKLHPLLVHLPIGLLLGAAVLEFVRRRRGEARPSTHAMACLVLGAAGAIGAATAGWSNALTAGHGGTTAWILAAHRWLGISTAGLSVLAVVLAVLARRVGEERLFAGYRVLMVFTVLVLAVTSHFGGSLVYGPEYIADALASLRGRGGRDQPTVVLAAGRPVSFATDIDPILARRCLSCHSGDKPEASLNLTSREGALKGGKSGSPAIVPGDPDASLLVHLVSGGDPKRQMPPKGGALQAGEIAVLREWIRQGAAWDEHKAGEHWHWAYRPPVRGLPPPASDPTWVRNEIDQFVMARLDREGLKPSAEAPRHTLLRRVSLDLTGLPPTSEEVRAFEADNGPGAYERAVERLLASTRFGEHWARMWLDLARYADTHGYEKDTRRVMWPWRDWVIKAFNDDMPFDRFTITQLAGDLLPAPTLDDLVATGFHRNTMINEEGGVDPEEFRVDAVLDRVNTTASVWLGTTLSCAQCHDHKFDPFSQKDYYGFFAIFNQDDPDVVLHATGANAAGGMRAVSTRERWSDFSRIDSEIRRLELTMNAPDIVLDGAQSEWELLRRSIHVSWFPLTPVKAESDGGVTLSAEPDGAVVVAGERPETATYTVDFTFDRATPVEAIRLEVLPGPSSPTGGVGRSDTGNFVLTEFDARILSASGQEGPTLALGDSSVDYEQPGAGGFNGDWSIERAIDGVPDVNGWAVDLWTKVPHVAVMNLRESATVQPGQILRVRMTQNYGQKHTIGKFRISIVGAPVPPEGMPIPADVADHLKKPVAARSAAESARVRSYFRSVTPLLRDTRLKLAELRAKLRPMIAANAPIMQRNAEPRATKVHLRGSFRSEGDAVTPSVPRVLGTLPSDREPDRLALAQWLVDGKNPLTARVQVNRLWARVFGRGLVETEEDFGTQGEPPTHPELLDWLATEFVQSGWSLKHMLRLMVTSSTYRQDSAVTAVLAEKDPMNRLLARSSRLRLDAEVIRDTALRASGLLSDTMFGPSVFPPQPPGIWTMIYSADQWTESQGDDRYRRGLYTFWRRTAPYPTFAMFDAPSREVTCTRRPRTTTPLQALATLNDPQFVEAAGALAADLASRSEWSTGERLDEAFRRVVAREPTPEEAARLTRLLDEQKREYTIEPTRAEELCRQVPRKHDGIDTTELAAWTVVSNVILNLDEALTRE